MTVRGTKEDAESGRRFIPVLMAYRSTATRLTGLASDEYDEYQHQILHRSSTVLCCDKVCYFISILDKLSSNIKKAQQLNTWQKISMLTLKLLAVHFVHGFFLWKSLKDQERPLSFISAMYFYVTISGLLIHSFKAKMML